MESWRKSDGTLFFSGIEMVEKSDVFVVVGDDIYYALKDLSEDMPYSNIVGYVLNSDILDNMRKFSDTLTNVTVTDNIDDVIYMLYEFSAYTESINTLVFPGTLSTIKIGSSLKQFEELLNEFIEMNFTNVVVYDSFCYKSMGQLTPLDLYLSVIDNPRFRHDMIYSYELFYGSIMYYENFIRFFMKYQQWERYNGGYEWFDILEDCQELSLNWNDFVKRMVSHNYRVSYIKMFAEEDIKNYIKEATGHTIKVATQTRAVFTLKNSTHEQDL